MRLWLVAVVSSWVLGCARSAADTCASDADCPAGDGGGAFCATRCLPLRGDFDLDGVSNAAERDAGSNPLSNDSDGDGVPDRVEFASAFDLDRDGVLDVNESRRADEDGDCIPDEADPRDAGPERDEINLRRQCRFEGACTNTFARQRASCVDGVLTCLLDGAPYPTETCDGTDDDCDGVVDEGCADGGVARGPFFDPALVRDGDAPGTLVLEAPLQVVYPRDRVATSTLELDWVTSFSGRCVPRDDEPAPRMVVEVATRMAQTDFSTDGPGRQPELAPRDARGRQARLSAWGRVTGSLSLEHLAGTWQVLVVRCESERRAGRDLAVHVPVFIRPAGNQGETLAPLTRPEPASCSTAGGLAPVLAALVLLCRRRRVGAPAVLLALLAACGAPTEKTSGHGPANVLPLWPMGGAQQAPWGEDELAGRPSTLPFGYSMHSQRRVGTAVEHRFDRGFNPLLPGLGLRVEANGDVLLTSTHYGPLPTPALLVPSEVRVGMTWEATLPLEQDTLSHFIDLPLEYGDGRFRFTVSHRQEVHTRFGPQVLWRIEWAGPPMPFGRDAYGRVHTMFVLLEVPTTEQARLRGSFDFVEGSGPVNLAPFFHALDAFAHYRYTNYKQGWAEPRLAPLASEEPRLDGERDAASDLAERAFPPLDGLADAVPQEAPTLAPTTSQPLTEEGLMPRLARLTRSSREGFGDLVMAGYTAPRASFIDPTGNTTGVYFPTATAGCGRLDEAGQLTGAPPPGQCPDRVQLAAQPYVGPDGARWDTASITQVLAVRPASSSVTGFEPLGPFWKDGAFFSVGRDVGQAGRSALYVRSFGGALPSVDLLDEPGTAGDTVPGAPVFPLPGDLASAETLSFAVPFASSLAYLQLGSVGRLDAIPLGQLPGVVTWVDWSGVEQQRLTLVGSRYGWTLVDGAHRLMEVGQLGELRHLHVEATRVWAELLGRVTLPEGHVGGSALWLGGDRYLVLSQEAPEFRITGWVEDNTTAHSLGQRRPAAGRVFGHVVTAPSTGLVDREWQLRHLAAAWRGGAVEACVPPGSDLRIDGARLGARLVDSSALERRGPRCWRLTPTADDEARFEAAQWTPLALRVAGEGWVLRPLPAPTGKMKRSRAHRAATAAAPPTGAAAPGAPSCEAVAGSAWCRWPDDAARSPVPLAFSVTSLQVSGERACLLDAVGRVSCWRGGGVLEWLGGWHDVQRFAMSGERVCALRAGGRLSCIAGAAREDVFPAGATRVWGGAGGFVVEVAGQLFGLGALERLKPLGGPWGGPWAAPTLLSGVQGARDVVLGPREACFLFEREARCAGERDWARVEGRFVAGELRDGRVCLLDEKGAARCR